MPKGWTIPAAILLVLAFAGVVVWQIGQREGGGLEPVEGAGVEAYWAGLGSIIFNQTQEQIGPGAALVEHRYARAGLNCSSCHINGGINPSSFHLVGVAARYPRVDPQTGEEQTLAQRINQCVEHSLNGRPLPEGSHFLRALQAYLQFLQPTPASAKLDEVTQALLPGAVRPPFSEGGGAGDRIAGARIFQLRCAACHGSEGEGVRAVWSDRVVFSVPPLWGRFSFNHLAGMHRPETAARFIYENMPMDDPSLTEQEARDVAAYVLSHPRP